MGGTFGEDRVTTAVSDNVRSKNAWYLPGYLPQQDGAHLLLFTFGDLQAAQMLE
jgi:hypothetical protein